MSREYPCVYFDDGKCRKDPPEENYVDWCVMGPCPHETPSNGDRWRNMTDEELAWEIMTFRFDAYASAKGSEACLPNSQKTICEWLKQPVKVAGEDLSELQQKLG